MVSTVVLLIFFNITVWAMELARPYHEANARVKRSGLLLLLYLPLWAILSNIILAIAFQVFSGRSLFQHGRNLVTGVWVSLLLALVFALLHRPLLSLLGRFVLRGRQGLWAITSAVFGVVAGAVEYLIVRSHVRVSPITLLVFCITSALVGYCVGWVRSIKPINSAI